MAKPARLFFAGLGTAISFAFNPLLSGSILIFFQYAPTTLQEPVLDFLAPYISLATLGRLIKLFTFTFWTNIAATVNSYLSWRAQNNWVEDKYDWDKEIVLITGASSGIGERVTELLAQKAVKVIVLDIQPPKEHIAAFKTVHFYHCDVTNTSQLASVAARIQSDHGDPTVLVNNAGIGLHGSILEKNITQIQKVLDINLVSHFSMIQQFLPSIVRNNHGHVVSIASMASYIAVGGMVDYCASKAGVAAFHEGLRQELKHIYKANKVRTSIVHPSWVKTPLLLEDWEKGLKGRGHLVMKLDDVAVPLADLILSGYSTQLLLPRNPVIYLMPGLRGWSHWAQEAIRDKSRLWG
ncbi:hypothetical protein ABW19_dt0200156 [Dactylella cylindrospora]|nr:hypothetical protein ABW19_dt0200156 [Dactylella cylindrospora]